MKRVRELYNTVMTHPDLLIIGGGIIGLTTAYLAAKTGLTVEVCDRADLGREASWAGAGILPPGNSTHAATPYDKLRAMGSEGMPAFAVELRERTGIDNGYLRCGGIEFLQPEDRYALELWDAERIRYEALDREQLRELEPEILNVPGDAFLLPDCAQVRNPWHMRALLAACEQVGVRLKPYTPAVGWVFDDSRVVGVTFVDGSVRHAGRYLLAAGAWSESLLKPLGHSPGVHPVQGQMLPFQPAAPVISRVLMVGKEYLVPRADGLVLAGSTEEPEVGFAKQTTLNGFRKLQEFATTLVPELKRAELLKSWAGLRPGTVDGWPHLGIVPGTENVLVAAGHFRSGVQLSLGSAQVMVELLTGKTPSVPLENFRLDRTPVIGKASVFRS